MYGYFNVCDVYGCDVNVRVYGGEEGACLCVCVWICDSLGCILIMFIVLCQEHRKGPPLVQQLPLELPPVSNATECACGV